ncbi:MAG TPA: hypothetical protein VFL57_12000 [Bryobacteraceae bacterium]|nr:hypothetical protein [Bryobacteraceae bacterium]
MRIVAALVLLAGGCAGQDFTQRGFLDVRLFAFPQRAANDSSHAVGEALLRYEVSRVVWRGLRLHGNLDARTDTHHQTERSARLDWQERSLQRPAVSIRRVSAVYSRAGITTEIGKQFVRWGKTDILTPTDRFAPRDFLAVVDNDFFGIPAVRVMWERGPLTLDAVWQVRFTPSRAPLPNQRWTVVPEQARLLTIHDLGAVNPGGTAVGLRANYVGSGFDAAVSVYDGWNHLPLLEARVEAAPLVIGVRRIYPQLRMYGADGSVPLRWFSVKGETAWFRSATRAADEYVHYVVQLERTSGEWVFVGGYGGEHVAERRSSLRFAPDRGLTSAFLGRASYTIDVNRSVAFEAAVRRTGDGVWLRGEYSHALGQHWRATAGVTLIRGELTDFLGQYRRNSHADLAVRYSF